MPSNISFKDRTKIRELRKEGLSGSKIAREIGRRKKDVLAEIRKIELRPKSLEKIHFFKEPENKTAVDTFIDTLYSEGYSKQFIKKIVHEKHKTASIAYIDRRMKNEPKENTELRGDYQKEVRARGREYARNRQEGRYYRETEVYYLHPVEWAVYHSMAAI